MQIPTGLKIGGHTYRVQFDSTLRGDDGLVCIGQHRGPEELIVLHSGFPPGTQEACLIHEILEALNWSLELGLEHRQISALEEGLYQVLKDNHLNFDE